MPRDFLPCPVIDAAMSEGAQTKAQISRRLLCGVARSEGDSALGLLVQAILDATPGASPTEADFDLAEDAAGLIRTHADELAEEMEGAIAYDRQPLKWKEA